MTSKEFVTWLRGFTEGVHEFNVTPKQWDHLKEKLSQVKDEVEGQFSITPAKEGFGYYENSTSTYNIKPKKQQLND